MTLLSSELRILGVSPSWAETERALDRLDSLRAGGEQPAPADLDEQAKKDLRTVHDFYEMLAGEAHSLALALLCGAVLGQVARADTFGERLVAGLRTLSRMYRLEARSGQEKAQALEELAGWLRNVGHQSVVATPSVAPRSLSADEWSQWVEKVRQAGTGLLPTEDWIEGQVHAAWETWGPRIKLIGLSMQRRFDPSLPELWCAAAGELPARLLVPDLDGMKLGDWSQLVIEAIAGPPEGSRPYLPYAALLALGQLGFEHAEPERLLQALRAAAAGKETPEQPESEPAPGWEAAASFLARRPSRTRKALVIRRDQGSLTESWMPPRAGGVLALTREQLWQRALIESVGNQPPLLGDLEIDLIAVELEPGEASGVQAAPAKPSKRQRGELKATLGSLLTFSQPEQIAQLLAEWGPPPTVVYLAADSSVRVPTDHPVIYAPPTADDLLSMAPLPPAAS